MTSMNQDRRRGRVVIGVDTHKYVHVAVALNDFGGVLGAEKFPADTAGYRQLIDWATTHGHLLTFAIEGTGSYGAGLTAAVRRRDVGVIEVMRTDRRDRRLRGKSDFLDAENAARAVLAGHADAVPKSADGVVEMIRTIKVAKDVAVKARTSAMISLKAILVNAPTALREQLQPLSKMALIHRCAALRPGSLTTVEAATKHTLRSIARRWEALNDEITAHEKLLAELTAAAAPQLGAAFGIGADTAAEMLIVAGDNPERVRSEPAWARLCGVAPIPASSGRTTRHRLNRGGHRQANAALYRSVIVRMQHHEPTKAYVARRTAEGKTKAEIIRCLIGGVSPVRLGQRLAVAPRSCRGMASLPRQLLMASLSTASLDAPRPSTGVRDMPDTGPNNEGPAKGLDTAESTTDSDGRQGMSYVGWDWASRTHDVTVLDDDGGVRDRWAFEHTESGWTSTLHRLRRHGEPHELPVIIERTSGLVVDRLLGAGHPVVPVHPASFYAARPRWGASGAKSDPGDSYKLADYLRTDGHRLRRLEPTESGLRELQALVRLRDDQVRARTAATNQLAATLDAHWPGPRDLFRSLASPIALAFLTDYPTPQAAAHLGEVAGASQL